MYQHEAVKKVMEKNGGYATLRYLYKNALKVPNCEWKIKTPYASIRRIVQKKDIFFKIRPGLWALKTYKNKLPENIYPKESDEDEKIKYNHTYFQGIIVKLGKFKGKETYIPKQDKNKIFLNEKLKNISTLSNIYKFGYNKIIDRAKTIDVTWFNKRKMPHSFFEVEFSTNFQNSLIKFTELQDYHVNFIIVAGKSRKRQYEKKSLIRHLIK